jgi:hypothetical protein
MWELGSGENCKELHISKNAAALTKNPNLIFPRRNAIVCCNVMYSSVLSSYLRLFT